MACVNVADVPVVFRGMRGRRREGYAEAGGIFAGNGFTDGVCGTGAVEFGLDSGWLLC